MSADDAQYRSYLGHLRSKIGAVWEYPPAAREQGLNGVVTVRFTIARNGNLKALTIKKKSPHLLLDNEALRTIRAAAPFLPFPPEFSIEKLHVLASFEYEFNQR
jgi:protein TonB